MVGGIHDFTDKGFSGQGVCDECHVPHEARDVRLFPRPGDESTFGIPPKRLCMDCHDGSLPSDPEWQGYAGSPPPDPRVSPKLTHQIGPGEPHERCYQCHPHKDSFRAVCNGCHTFPGIAGTTSNPALHDLSETHDRHAGVPSDDGVQPPTMGYGCTKCHNEADHNTAGLSDPSGWDATVDPNPPPNHVQVRFDGWNPDAQAANPPDFTQDTGAAYFDDATNTCDNLYCHSDAREAKGGSQVDAPRYATATWVATNPVNPGCEGCHGQETADGAGYGFGAPDYANQGAATQSANSHGRHVAYPFPCAYCHVETTQDEDPSDGWTLDYGGLHVNRSIDVRIKGSLDSDADPGNNYTAASKTCANLYCHSDGRTAKAGTPADPPRETPLYATVAWGDPNPGCEGCHGSEADDTAGPPYSFRYGMPDYANLGTATQDANSHAAHVAMGYPCAACHQATVTDTEPADGWTLADLSRHADGTIDVAIRSDYDATPADPADNYDAATKTCSNIVCHGSGTPQWGGAGSTDCATCHLGVSDVDDFVFGDGTLAAVQGAGQWDASGHGAAGPYPSGNGGAGFTGPAADPSGCAYCHDASVSHGLATNPFRLRNKDTLGRSSPTDGGWNDVCLVCHSGLDPDGYDPDGAGADYGAADGKDVDAAHSGAKHDAAADGGAFCWDCHDPHGDGNHYMMQAQVTDVSDGVYGVPASTRSFAGFDVVSGGYTSADLARDTTFDGLCQVCHTDATLPFSQSRYTAPADHYGHDTQRCTSCHTHPNGFAPTCNTCHGDAVDGATRPPTAPQDKGLGGTPQLSWPASVDPATGSTYDNIGNHRTVSTTADPVEYSSHEGFSCKECHTDTPGSGATHDDGLPNATMDNLSDGRHDWSWNGQSPALAASWHNNNTDGASAAQYSVTDARCDNIDCHSPYYANQGTGAAPTNPYRSGTPYPYRRYWINENLWDCYTCHGYDGTTATSRPIRDKMATGSHGRHLTGVGASATNPAYPCDACHPDNVGSLWHKNGAVDLPFGAAIDPYAAAESYSQAGQAPTDGVTAQGHRAYGTCTNVYCHSTVQSSPPGGAPTYATPTWGAAAGVTCGSCHDADPNSHLPGTGVYMSTGSHLTHTDPNHSPSYAYQCTTCHVSNSCLGCHGSGKHGDGAIDLPLSGSVGTLLLSGTFDTDGDLGTDEELVVPGPSHAAYGTCTNVYCHSDAKERKSFVSAGTDERAPAYAAIQWGTPGPLGCEGCHGAVVPDASGSSRYGAPDYANEGSSTQAANSHGAHVGSGIACAACHQDTLTDEVAGDGWTLSAFGKHVDGEIDVVIQGKYDDNGVGTDNYDAATKTCSNVTCHGGNPVQWGQQDTSPVGCVTCHLDPSADTDDFTWNDFQGTAAKVSQAEWEYAGHGKDSGAYDKSGSGAANFAGPASDADGCRYCHDFSAGHGEATNPFRLANRGAVHGTGGADGGWNDVCLICHSSAAGGYDPDGAGGDYGAQDGADVDANHYNARHDAPSDGGTFCWDCHDPHGDRTAGGGNIYMVQREVARVSDGAYGIPVTAAAPTFVDNATGTDYAKSASPYDGICNVCHTATNHYTDASGDGHNSGTRCTQCHVHAKGFAGDASDCDRCHVSATADLDDYGFANGTTAQVWLTEWEDSGHGRNSGSYDVSGSGAAAFAGPPAGADPDPHGCHYCHDYQGSTHGDPGNFFRLANRGAVGGSGGADGGWNGVCLVCHSSQDADGYDPDGAGSGYAARNGRDVDSNHANDKHDAASDGGTFCWDCHDPHGDRAAGAGNIYMVHAQVTQVSDGVFGKPVTTVAPVFVANTTGTDYAKSSGSYDGICQVCHTTTNHYTASSGDGHNAALRCTQCHRHASGFAGGADNSCLHCHTSDTSNGGGLSNLKVDALFNGIGYDADDPSLMSQHNIRYDQTGAVDRDVATPDTPDDNECKKCHGSNHPSSTRLLVYPDDYGTHKAGDPVPRAATGEGYQEFCLACHDGRRKTADGAYPASFQQLNGTDPAALGQVRPTDPADPAAQQTSAPWSVPPVPPKNPDGTVNAVPYFENDSGSENYFETNGHGRASGMSGQPMNYTCLNVAGGEGCHVAHGSKNRFLIEDSGNMDGGTGLPGEALDTVGEFAVNICYACHTYSLLKDPDFAGGYAQNFFHTWKGDQTVVHDGQSDPGASQGLGGAPWDVLTGGFMDIADKTYAHSGALAFWADLSAPIQARVYTPNDPGSATKHILTCLTCHDPHGTAGTWVHNESGAADSTQGMPRRYPKSWDYLDPLCSECHGEP
ncbi:MAG: hypothetical protein Kow0092_13550 [Deferrisomatales bacterium]